MEDVQITAKYREQKTSTKPEELYRDILALPETGEISIFKSSTYKVSVCIRFDSSNIRPFVCMFDTGAGLNLVGADVLDQSLLNNICQSDMLEIWIASETRPVLYKTITHSPLSYG